MYIEILQFSFNSVMEFFNSSLLVHLPALAEKMPMTPESGISLALCSGTGDVYVCICCGPI